MEEFYLVKVHFSLSYLIRLFSDTFFSFFLQKGTVENFFRVGIVLEEMETDLEFFIQTETLINDISVQYNIGKKVASAMNFLHSLHPPILHRDLRTPNVLISRTLQVKIADFGSAFNSAFSESLSRSRLYTLLIPPECKDGIQHFSIKGDVYVSLDCFFLKLVYTFDISFLVGF